MKKLMGILIILFIISTCWGQTNDLKVIQAKIGYTPDFSLTAQKNWEKGAAILEQIGSNSKKYEDLTPEEVELVNGIEETRGFWNIIGGGCSWYCGGGPHEITASSFLPPTSKFTYEPKNAHDDDFRTAWVEGVKGYGIGENISYYFPAKSPRVNKILIFNGYVKSVSAWKNNSRVKKLKLYVNDKPYAILVLEDTRALQEFPIEPMQSTVEGEDLILTFEILEVYKGDEWDDVAITEIYFDGLDVHCLVEGTMIKMSNGTEKPIEELKINDEIVTYNFITKEIGNSKILELANETHCNLVKLFFNEVEIISTDDHPYYVKKKGWSSFNPRKSDIYDNINQARLLETGDNIMFLNKENKIKWKKLLKFENLNQIMTTYTITKLDKNHCFFANGLLVGIEELE